MHGGKEIPVRVIYSERLLRKDRKYYTNYFLCWNNNCTRYLLVKRTRNLHNSLYLLYQDTAQSLFSDIPPSPRNKTTDKCGSTLLIYQNKLTKLRKLPCKVQIPWVKPNTSLNPQLKFLNFMCFCIKLIFLSTSDTTKYINPFTKTDIFSV